MKKSYHETIHQMIIWIQLVVGINVTGFLYLVFCNFDNSANFGVLPRKFLLNQLCGKEKNSLLEEPLN